MDASRTIVDTDDINTGAVTTSKIADTNVTTGKIADLAVTTPKIDNLSVTPIKLSVAEIAFNTMTSVSTTQTGAIVINRSSSRPVLIIVNYLGITTAGTANMSLSKDGAALVLISGVTTTPTSGNWVFIDRSAGSVAVTYGLIGSASLSGTVFEITAMEL